MSQGYSRNKSEREMIQELFERMAKLDKGPAVTEEHQQHLTLLGAKRKEKAATRAAEAKAVKVPRGK